jgi:hypothetical protein
MSKTQDELCTYNLTLRRFHITIVTVESNKCYIFCVFLALVILHEMLMCHITIIICVLPESTVFFHFIS